MEHYNVPGCLLCKPEDVSTAFFTTLPFRAYRHFGKTGNLPDKEDPLPPAFPISSVKGSIPFSYPGMPTAALSLPERKYLIGICDKCQEFLHGMGLADLALFPVMGLHALHA